MPFPASPIRFTLLDGCPQIPYGICRLCIKGWGGATNGFGIVVGYPYKPLQLLPLFLVGAADIFAGNDIGVSDISVPLISQKFTEGGS